MKVTSADGTPADSNGLIYQPKRLADWTRTLRALKEDEGNTITPYNNCDQTIQHLLFNRE